MSNPSDVMIPVSPGELLDKITILMIKTERLTDPEQLQNVEYELAELQAVRAQAVKEDEHIATWCAALKTVNERLWQIEDDIRACERQKDFGAQFVELARAVYVNNDERARLKRQINEKLGSRIVEEKSYQGY